ncbi:MAG: hypothetical protein HFJ12_03640 [Bacilli bacterium]|nr:hypothetical protein [Bacilli bacterium]
MNKILVSVKVPTIEEEYDLFIPIGEKMDEILLLIQKSINELSDGYYEINEHANLYDSIGGKVINKNNIVRFSGLKNGSKVILL